MRYKIFSFKTYSGFIILIIAQINILDIPINIMLSWCNVFCSWSSKWRCSCQKFIGENSYSPIVYFVIIWRLLYHFRCKIIWSTTKCWSILIYRMRWPPEITEFDMPGRRIHDKDVFRFDISMNDISLLKEPKCRDKLLYNFASYFLIKC